MYAVIIKATDGMQRSCSGKAYPWDNARIKFFHALIKREWLPEKLQHDTYFLQFRVDLVICQ